MSGSLTNMDVEQTLGTISSLSWQKKKKRSGHNSLRKDGIWLAPRSYVAVAMFG